MIDYLEKFCIILKLVMIIILVFMFIRFKFVFFNIFGNFLIIKLYIL